MKRSAKVVLLIASALLLLLPSSRSLRAERFQNPTAAVEGNSQPPLTPKSQGGGVAGFKEYNYYYNGAQWVAGWFQCDEDREVSIFSDGRKGKTFHYESFPKSQPSKKTVLSLRQKGDEDCGMMKCYFTLVAPGKSFVVLESNYKDDEAYWTSPHSLTSERGKGRASPDEHECRWLERTRLAVITDRRSIYVTESEMGDLEYRSYNYKGASDQPAVMLKGGVRTFDAGKGVEIFTFQNGEYTYVLNVSTVESRPSVEVLVKKKGAVAQQERCLSYTYLKKS
jgi:hypothetical protein